MSITGRTPRSVGAGFREHDTRIEYFIKFNDLQNFGDYLPELICKTLLLHPKVDADVFRLIGSVIESRWAMQDLRRATGAAKGRIAYWGCGMRQARPLDPAIEGHCLFFGVRGPRTRDALRLPQATVLGDPGLLAPLFHAPASHPETQGRSICIPHVADPKSDEELRALSGAEVVVRPLIEASESGLREILDKIASAEFVLTGSLHGAVIACAYGRPFAFWDTGHVDVPFKWEDFAASVEAPCIFTKDLAEGRRTYEHDLAPRLKIPRLAPILDICPFQARPSALLRALAIDGELSPDVADEAARVLERLGSMDLFTIHALQDISAGNRALRGAPGAVVTRLLGSKLRAAKRELVGAMERLARGRGKPQAVET